MTMMDKPILDSSDSQFETQFSRLLVRDSDSQNTVIDLVREIIDTVQSQGDAALLDYTNRYDRIKANSLAELRVSDAEFAAAAAAVSPELTAAIDLAAQRIEAFHRRQIPLDDDFVDDGGTRLGSRWTAVDSAGLYVPGGTASYPSSVLMNAIPARVAAVPRLVMVTPCPDGKVNPLVLVAAARCGIGEVWKIGGAQAIAALAYGTQSIAAVDVIAGPGNDFVATAKRLVYGKVGIDSIAGPSEILIICDRATAATTAKTPTETVVEWMAADLLSQAEHDVAAQAILITPDLSFAQLVAAAVARQLTSLPRRDIAAQSWRDYGAIILVKTLDEAATLANRIAPEHLQLVGENAEALLPKIRHAGAIFLGTHSPEAIGDYIAGPNHVLPTSGTARFSSGLSVLNFMKRSNIIRCNQQSFATLAPAAALLADSEGLAGHARSLRLRSE